MVWIVVAVVVAIALAIRLTQIGVRYRRIRQEGHNVRWEAPIQRWWRSRR